MKIKHEKLNNFIISRKSEGFMVTISDQSNYVQIKELSKFMPDKIYIHKDILQAILKVLT